MRLFLSALLGLVSVAVLSAQDLTPARPVAQHATAVGTTRGAFVAGGRATLLVDVVPSPGVHIYAPGVKGLSPVTLILTPNRAIGASKPTFPASDLYRTVGIDTPVPVYRAPFRIAQPVTISRLVKPGETLTLAAAINYQACDERLCYPEASLPVVWNVIVK